MPTRLFAPAAAALCLMLPLATPAPAGEIAEAAAAAELALASGDFDAWTAANQTLQDALWAAPGLHFTTLALVSTEANGYGNYDLRADNAYAVDEPILIYAEPKGFGYGDLGDGRFEIAFDIGLKVLDKDGTLLGEVPKAMDLVYSAQGKPREFMANISYSLTGLAPGEYTLDTTLTDRHGGQSASFTSDIVIR